MAGGAEEIIARLVLLGQRAFVSGLKESSQAVEGVGTAQEKTAKKSRFSARGLVKWAAAAGIVYKAAQYIKSAVDTTVSLAKATAGLQRVTGMDARTASAWATTAKERGIAAQSLQRGFLTLGRSINGAAAGSKQSLKLFDQLGLSLRNMTTGGTEKRLERVADALLKVKDPVQRAALGQKLLGRAYLQLSPLLAKGSKGIRANQKEIARLGGTMDKKGVKSALEAAKAQRELNTAMTGLQLTIGTALLPTLVPLIKSFSEALVSARPLFKLIAANPKIVLGLAAAVWALNIAMTANPYVAITLGIIALGAALYLCYKKFKWFHNAVDMVWDVLKATFLWVKKHWPLLAAILGGPFVVAAYVIVTHFATIKKAIGAAVAFIFRVIRGLTSFVRRAVRMIGSAISTVTGPVGSVVGTLQKGAGLIGHVPGLATGGAVVQGGTVLVGERGPELLSLPSGSQVTPLASPALVSHGGGAQSVIAKVYLDKRVLATAVAEVGADRRARR